MPVSAPAHPEQQNAWYEAALFADLLSVEDEYTPRYYRDILFTDFVDAKDYIKGIQILD